MVFRSVIAWILVGAAALVAGAEQDNSSANSDEVRRVVVIHFDTTRVDDFGCYGSFVQTPNVDAVAARGMRYTNAVTCAHYTSPSIATFMTGRYPVHHGVNGVGDRLGQDYTTLAEILQADHELVTTPATAEITDTQVLVQSLGDLAQ